MTVSQTPATVSEWITVLQGAPQSATLQFANGRPLAHVTVTTAEDLAQSPPTQTTTVVLS